MCLAGLRLQSLPPTQFQCTVIIMVTLYTVWTDEGCMGGTAEIRLLEKGNLKGLGKR